MCLFSPATRKLLTAITRQVQRLAQVIHAEAQKFADDELLCPLGTIAPTLIERAEGILLALRLILTSTAVDFKKVYSLSYCL
jgi:hypothetical protein